ncbi:MAG TPA: hypothetical protein VLI90_10370 [Tepidisphaeraceae bacterium]|nr:hypothetical protein [Tepidisphaeraceae bacterium]
MEPIATDKRWIAELVDCHLPTGPALAGSLCQRDAGVADVTCGARGIGQAVNRFQLLGRNAPMLQDMFDEDFSSLFCHLGDGGENFGRMLGFCHATSSEKQQFL